MYICYRKYIDMCGVWRGTYYIRLGPQTILFLLSSRTDFTRELIPSKLVPLCLFFVPRGTSYKPITGRSISSRQPLWIVLCTILSRYPWPQKYKTRGLTSSILCRPRVCLTLVSSSLCTTTHNNLYRQYVFKSSRWRSCCGSIG